MPKKETKRCKYCRNEFKPHVRQKARQVACFDEDCQKAHKHFLNHRSKAKERRDKNNKIWRKFKKDKELISEYNERYYDEKIKPKREPKKIQE